MSAQAIQWQTWDLAAESDRRFRRLVISIGIPLLLIGIAVPFLELVGLTRGGGTLAGARYVELLPEQPAPVAEKVEEPQPAEQDEPEPVAAKATPRPEPRPEPEVRPEIVQQRAVERARETAARSGVMAFADQLQALHTGVAAIAAPDDALRSLDSAGGSDSQADSRVFEQSAASASAGVGTPTGSGATRRAQSGTGLGERRTTVVESPVGVGQDRSRPGQGGDKLLAGRTINEIQQVFDRNKGALLAIINRALRTNPNIRGTLNIAFTIASDGSVSDLRIVSGSVGDPEVDERLLQRIRLINFGTKPVPPYKVDSYPLVLM